MKLTRLKKHCECAECGGKLPPGAEGGIDGSRVYCIGCAEMADDAEDFAGINYAEMRDCGFAPAEW